MSSIRVLSVASEIYPIIKTGGLADVAGALPGALKQEGVEAQTLIPGYPAVMEAIERQLRKGTCFPGSSEPQLEFARLICQRIPSVERIRFTNSGTEASLNAIRAARAFTGRKKIAKVEGGYHGTADDDNAMAAGEA